MLDQTSYSAISIQQMTVAVAFTLIVLVVLFIVVLIQFLMIKKLRVQIHNKTFEDLLKDKMITNADFNLLKQ